MDTIPDDVLGSIFSMLSGKQRASICTVSKLWCKIALLVSFGDKELTTPEYICNNAHRFIRLRQHLTASDHKSIPYMICAHAPISHFDNARVSIDDDSAGSDDSTNNINPDKYFQDHLYIEPSNEEIFNMLEYIGICIRGSRHAYSTVDLRRSLCGAARAGNTYMYAYIYLYMINNDCDIDGDIDCNALAACKSGNLKLVQMLIKLCTNLHIPGLVRLLATVVSYNNIHIAKWILDSYPEIILLENEFNDTYMAASKKCTVENLKYYEKLCKDLTIDNYNRGFIIACKGNNVPVVEYLEPKLSDITIAYMNGYTNNKHIPTQYLLKYPSKINFDGCIKMISKSHAYHTAQIVNGVITDAKQCGVTISTEELNNCMLLVYNHVDIVKLLIENGADDTKKLFAKSVTKCSVSTVAYLAGVLKLNPDELRMAALFATNHIMVEYLNKIADDA